MPRILSRRRARRLFTALALTFACGLTVSALFSERLPSTAARAASLAVADWTRSGPHTGNVSALAVSNSSPSFIYAAVQASGVDYIDNSRSGVYKSTDGGASWLRTAFATQTMSVYTLAVDPTNPFIVYAGSARGLFVSTDGGDHWSGPFLGDTAEIIALAVNPSTPSVVFASKAGFGVYKSTDGGANWNYSGNGINYFAINSIVFDPTNANIVYAAGGSFARLFKSTDGGNNWSSVNTGVNSLPASLSLALDPSNSSIMYAGTTHGFYKSVNGGASWAASNAGLPTNAAIVSLSVNPSNTSVLFATIFNGGVFKSTDAGATWTPAITGATKFNVVALDTSGANVYAGSIGSGVYKSTDGGTNWGTSNEGMPFAVVTHLLTDPNNPAVVHAGTRDGVYTSADRAESWSASGLAGTVRPVMGFVNDPTRPLTYYAALDYTGVLKTLDGGLNWRQQTQFINTNVNTLAIAPTAPQTLYFSTYPFRLQRSTDGGVNWPQISSPGNAEEITVDPTNANIVYAASSGLGVYKSVNAGTNWSGLGSFGSGSQTFFNDVTIDSSNPNTIYVTSRGTAIAPVRKSTDGGASWNDAATGIPSTNAGAYDVRALVVHPLNPSILYAACYGATNDGGGVYRSLDGGTNWTLFQSALAFTNELAFDLSGKTLYVGTAHGVYKTTLTAQAITFASDIFQANESAGAATVTVTRDSGAGTLTVNFATSDGTATAGQDYTHVSGSLIFAEGETSKTFNVQILNDNLDEFDEAVRLTLTNADGTSVLSRAACVIADDDLDPVLTVSDVSAPEGDFDTTNFVFNVSLSTPTAKTVTFDVNNADGTAIGGGGDYFHYGGPYTFTFAPGETNKTVNISVKGDLTVEPDETFFVNVSNVSNASAGDLQGQGTIQNDDATPTVSLSINDASVTEGNSGTTDAVFTVTLSAAASKTVMVDYSSSAGAGTEYQGAFGTLIFEPGQTTKTFTIRVLGDTRFEQDEQFEVRLSNPRNALLGDDTGMLTILNDEAAPTISISDVVVTEGDTGQKEVVFFVTLSVDTERQTLFQYTAAPGTAVENEDYFWVGGAMLFVPGITTQSISVPVRGDTIDEADETFFVRLSNADGATIADGEGQATIIDNDGTGGASTFQFSATQYTVPESVGEISITVTRSGDLSQPATVDYSTERSNNTRSASDRKDYTTAVGTLRFAADEGFKTFKVLINEDVFAERDPQFGDEFIDLLLSNPTGGVSLGTPQTAFISITDNDTSTGGPNPVDDPVFFVRQHYHDFLNREPDAGGLAFWTGNLSGCGADAQCIEVKRINVSAAFFLSIEFQSTGYQVIRIYKSSFPDSPSRPRGLPRYREFLRDTQEVQRGVIVGQGDWAQRLQQNTRDFARRWVDSAAFTTEFPVSMTAEQFVDKLFANAEATPTQGERDAALAAFGAGGTEGRAAALLSVTNTGSVYNKQYNPAFVLMQYIGYLRRSPNDLPDTGFGGFDFWLAKMNEFSLPGEDVRNESVALGRVQRAEMIKAFLSSIEYRTRFAP